MACRLFGTKPLSKAMLGYCHLKMSSAAILSRVVELIGPLLSTRISITCAISTSRNERNAIMFTCFLKWIPHVKWPFHLHMSSDNIANHSGVVNNLYMDYIASASNSDLRHPRKDFIRLTKVLMNTVVLACLWLLVVFMQTCVKERYNIY